MQERKDEYSVESLFVFGTRDVSAFRASCLALESNVENAECEPTTLRCVCKRRNRENEGGRRGAGGRGAGVMWVTNLRKSSMSTNMASCSMCKSSRANNCATNSELRSANTIQDLAHAHTRRAVLTYKNTHVNP